MGEKENREGRKLVEGTARWLWSLSREPSVGISQPWCHDWPTVLPLHCAPRPSPPRDHPTNVPASLVLSDHLSCEAGRALSPSFQHLCRGAAASSV